MVKSYDNKLLMDALNRASINNNKNKIGLLQEHTLHRTLKFYYSMNEENHEINIDGMFADVKLDNHIYEIQTKQLFLLKKKLDVFLKDYHVTICYPLFYLKHLVLYDDNNIISEKNSPKHENIFKFIKDLYSIKSYINNPNLSFDCMLLEVKEERLKVEKTYRRKKGYERLNHIPMNIINCYHFENKDDYKELIIDLDLPSEFTSEDFRKKTHLLKSDASTCLNVLYELKVVNRIGKIKNSYVYKINPES